MEPLLIIVMVRLAILNVFNCSEHVVSRVFLAQESLHYQLLSRMLFLSLFLMPTTFTHLPMSPRCHKEFLWSMKTGIHGWK